MQQTIFCSRQCRHVAENVTVELQRSSLDLILGLMVLDASVEALREELRTLDLHDATRAVRNWLAENAPQDSVSRSSTDVVKATVVSPPQLAPPGAEPPDAAPLKAPPAAAGQPAPSSNPVRMGKLYDAEPISSSRVPGELLMKPEPVFHGERDDRQREEAPVYEFPMHVRLLYRTPTHARLSCSLCLLLR